MPIFRTAGYGGAVDGQEEELDGASPNYLQVYGAQTAPREFLGLGLARGPEHCRLPLKLEARDDYEDSLYGLGGGEDGERLGHLDLYPRHPLHPALLSPAAYCSDQHDSNSGQGSAFRREVNDSGYCTDREASGSVTAPAPSTSSTQRLPCVTVKCLRCKEPIRERHVVLVNDGRFLHERCLRCDVCQLNIHLNDERGSIFLRDNKVYCKNDYKKLFSGEGKREMPYCIKCNVQLEKDNWVRRADNYLFHMTCFCCSKCSRQLSRWEQFVLREDRLICEKHFYEHDGSQKGDSPKPRAKRMRTSFTEEQVKILQQHFAIDSNPDGQDLERIAKLTGLKKRVTQVWFQNNRARHKKSLQQTSSGPGAGPSGPFSPGLPPSAMYVSASEEGDSVPGPGELGGGFPPEAERGQDIGQQHHDFGQQHFWSPMDN